MTQAINSRLRAQLDLQSPICIYALCKAQGIIVRFNGINMEGMYQKGKPSRIHISARRPLQRRAYNCAHELGHHIFGHGSSIDELRKDAKRKPHEDPKEFLADTFAGFVLMPTLGLRRAFTVRGLDVNTATPLQIYQIACEFGVGYTTLITHLTYGLQMLSGTRAGFLLEHSPKKIRANVLGDCSASPLVIVDHMWSARTIDVEVGTQIILPRGSNVSGGVIAPINERPYGSLFEAVKPGISQIIRNDSGWGTFVRVSRKEYIGLAEYRHLEENTDE